MRHPSLTALVTFSLLIFAGSFAAVPQVINYQGRLTDGVGNPLNSTEALTFTIYGDSLGATTLWTEVHSSVVVTNGLFQVILGSVTTLPQSVFDGNTRWLSVRVGTGASSALMPLVSTAYAYRSNVSDTASLAKTVSDNAITSAKIQNGTIAFADIGQNGATADQVIKWNGSAWAAQTDATSANTSGWTDGGTVVSLTTASDTVAINTSLRLGKLNVGGSMSLPGQSSIYFDTDSTFIKGYTGGDMSLQAEDLFAKTTGSIYFADVTAGNFMEVDNANRMVGVGTTAPDERLQVENDASGGRSFLQLETSHATNFGETGIRFKTPQNTWHLRMDDYTNNNIADGALGLRSQVGVEAMTWLEGGNVGIGTTNPTRKLHVYGSAMVKDTLYGGVIDPLLMSAARLPDESGVAGSTGGSKYLTGEWIVLDSLTINVPAGGSVLTLASVSFYVHHSYSNGADIVFGISPTNTTGPSVYNHWQYDNNSSTGDLDGPASCQRLFTVPSKGEYRYYFMAWGIFLEEDVRAEVPALTAVYFPTSYQVSKGIASEPQMEPRAQVTSSENPSQTVGNPGESEVISELRALREEVAALKKKVGEK